LIRAFNSEGSDGSYAKNYTMTLQADLTVKVVNVPDSNVTVELFLFDVGGHSMFNEYCPKFVIDG
jgi:transport family protein 27